MQHSGTYLDVIGQPFFNCENCGCTNLHQEITEWDLQPWLRKVALLVLSSVFVVLGSIFMAVTFITLMKWLHLVDSAFFTHYFKQTLLFFVALMTIAGIFKLRRDIRASRLRLTNPDYRAKLHAMGL
ncbi:hypothetical protein ACO0LC_19330 [Undibacterium sp. JH2W]|uniref:hypothetical protein n=1 Tax=Undibacterium sp. JH2W TaxID=3413037 RepID=UPI003BF3FF23